MPLLFMGEERSQRHAVPVLHRHDGELADAVREGRRKEFESFAAFSDPVRRATIPDPNDPRHSSTRGRSPDQTLARGAICIGACSRCGSSISCRS